MREIPSSVARDFMSTRLVTLAPETGVLQALQRLVEARVSGAPVLDGHGNLVGLLTQRDCLDAAVQSIYHQEIGGRVADFMTVRVETLDAQTPLMDVIEAFRRNRFRRFPVVEGGRLVGVISRRDVLQAILDLW